jgi:hypothetical protein
MICPRTRAQESQSHAIKITVPFDALSHPSRVAVVSLRNVGSTFVYALLRSGLASEIVLIDLNRRKAESEAMDRRRHSSRGIHFRRIRSPQVSGSSPLVGSILWSMILVGIIGRQAA